MRHSISHSERSEESLAGYQDLIPTEILRFAQNDGRGLREE